MKLLMSKKDIDDDLILIVQILQLLELMTKE